MNEENIQKERDEFRNSPEERIIKPLKRRMAWEGKKVERMLEGLRLATHAEVESAKGEILQSLRQIEHSVELLAQELASKKDCDKINNKDDAV